MTTLHEPSWDEARLAAFSSSPALGSESIPLNTACGRINATNIYALCDLPTYTTSAMDGYVLRGSGPWKIAGEILAGEPTPDTLLEGYAFRIATGAVIPNGGETVIEWESVEIVEDHVHATPRLAAHIRPAGAECRKGDLLVSRGSQLSPGMIGLLAAAGHDKVDVTRKPKVAIFLLGDELLHNGIPHNGKVRDAIGPQIHSWLEALGVEIVSKKYVPDQLNSLLTEISDAPECDLIVTTGGTADGPRDHVHPAIDALNGHYIVDRVRSRPGHPTLLAKIKQKNEQEIPILGLPGNPQSAIVGLMTLGAPLISALLGTTLPDLAYVRTRNELSAPPNFNRLILGNVVDGDFEMGDHLGSAMLRGLANSTGFAVAPSGISAPGTMVRWLPLPL